MLKRTFAHGLLLLMAVMVGSVFQPFASFPAQAQAGCQTFAQTGKQVCGRFLQYWQQNGGLAQQGLPLSGEFNEVSPLNGQTYTVQYFERAVFEKHPENAAPHDVLLSQLGTFQFKRNYPNGEPGTGGAVPTPTSRPAAPPPTAPVASGPKLDLVDYITYTPEFGGKRAVGYVKNTGNVDLARVQVIATFKDSAGRIVGTSTDDCTCVLRPDDFFPFTVGQSSSSPDFATVDFQLVFRPATTSDTNFYYNQFQVSDLNVVAPSGYSGLKVLGTVRNTGTAMAYLTQIHVLITDASGKVIDVDSTFASINELGPGASSPFEIELDNAKQAPQVKVAVYSFRR